MLTPQFDLDGILRAAGLLATCIALIWVLTRGALGRAALQRILAHPALLVPAAMTTAVLTVLLVTLSPATLHESPFGVSFARNLGIGRPTHWIALLVVAVGLAGQIGLLEALQAGRRPGARAMIAGVRRHLGTFVLAKIAIAGGVFLVSKFLGGARATLIVYLVPSLFLAPVAGTATLHPGHPVRAVRAAIETGYRHLFQVGWPVLAQAMALVGILFLLSRASLIATSPDLLTFSSSAVSFNYFPFALLPAPGAGVTIATLASVFVSAVFVTAHWSGAQSDYHAVRPAPATGPRA